MGKLAAPEAASVSGLAPGVVALPRPPPTASEGSIIYELPPRPVGTNIIIWRLVTVARTGAGRAGESHHLFGAAGYMHTYS